jgi:hypothetical protein
VVSFVDDRRVERIAHEAGVVRNGGLLGQSCAGPGGRAAAAADHRESEPQRFALQRRPQDVRLIWEQDNLLLWGLAANDVGAAGYGTLPRQ